MDMSNVINQMIVLMLLLLVGVAARKLKITDDVTSEKLTKIVLNLAQTAIILAAVMNVEKTLTGMELLGIVGLSCLTYAILIAFSFLVPVILRAKPEERGIYRFMTIFSNVGFIGFPVVASIFGPQAVFYTALFNLPFGIIAFSLGIILISGTGKPLPSFRQMLKQVMNGPTIATFISVALFMLEIKVPQPIADSIKLLGDIIVPCAMLIIGGTLGSMKLKEVFSGWRIYAFSIIRLIVVPLLVWSILRLFVTNQEILGIATVIVAMPVASISTMFSIEYGGGNIEVASKSVLMTTILSTATIPLIVYLLL